jgi:CheY-like chemotaxis protein
VEACALLLTPLSQMAHEVRGWALRGSGASAEELRALHERSQTLAPPHEGKQLLDEMLLAANSIANIVKDLRVFARSDSEREEPRLLDANDVVDQALRLVGRQISTMARVERDYARDLPQVLVPHGRLTQVLINVLVNAAHAIDEVERPVHRVRIMTRTDGESVAVSISDTGPGIPAHALDHIFDPFFTTKRAGYGTGLGLSISRAIMHDLGGDMIVESVHGSGATFILLLPIPDGASVRHAYVGGSNEPPLPRAGKRRTVLLVDDDEHVLSAYARALERTFDVLMAADGREAIELLSSGSSADALISELGLPQVDGKELYQWLQRERPALARRTVFVCVEANLQRYQAFVDDAQARVLVKPVTTSALLWALNDVLAAETNGGSQPPPT